MRNFYETYRCTECGKERSRSDLCPHMFEERQSEDLAYHRNCICIRCCFIDGIKLESLGYTILAEREIPN